MRAPCRVVLTRTPVDNARLRAVLEGIPAEIVEYPCIAIEPVPVASEIAQRLASGQYGSAFFVSRNAVEHLFAQIHAIQPHHVVALGSGTAEVLQAHGWKTSAQPSEARLDVAIRELDRLFPSNGRVLYVRGDLGADTLPEALRAHGVPVDVAVVYATRDAAERPLERDDRPQLISFASPSAVRHFASRNAAGGEAIAIGETTAQAAREAGFTVRVAPSSDVALLGQAIRQWVESTAAGKC